MTTRDSRYWNTDKHILYQRAISSNISNLKHSHHCDTKIALLTTACLAIHNHMLKHLRVLGSSYHESTHASSRNHSYRCLATTHTCFLHLSTTTSTEQLPKASNSAPGNTEIGIEAVRALSRDLQGSHTCNCTSTNSTALHCHDVSMDANARNMRHRIATSEIPRMQRSHSGLDSPTTQNSPGSDRPVPEPGT